jgi:hypothetical protein
LVEDEDEALYLTVRVDGAPAVDVLVISTAVAEVWVQTHERDAGESPPPGPVTFSAAVPAPAAEAAPVWRSGVRLPRGSHYVVFDHTAAAGQTPPSRLSPDTPAALVSYGVQLGQKP